MEHSLILIYEPKESAAIKHNTVSVVLALSLQHRMKTFLEHIVQEYIVQMGK